MKACIYNPYLDTLGGGERYSLTVAKVLAEEGYQVDVEWRDPDIKSKLEQRFGVSLNEVNIVSDVKKGDGYEICFWVSDGSIPLMHARHNILHFQVPFHGVRGKSLINRMKLFRINSIVCNSEFTKSIIDKEFGVSSLVLYPPVDTKNFKPKRKENIILYVGRFSKILQGKGQEFLITAFKKMFDSGLTDWRLVLAGGTEVGAGEFLYDLEENAAGYPIEILKSPDFKTLKDLYGKARIFWSASGFGHSQVESPEKMEHFGITVVEAMSAGVVPIVFNGGGHKEIVKDGENGFLWNDMNELLEKTKTLIDKKMNLSKKAVLSSKKYSYEEFRNNLAKIL